MTMTSIRQHLIIFMALTLMSASSYAEKEPALALQEAHRLTMQLSSDDWILQAEALELLGRNKVEHAVPEIEKILKTGKTTWIKGRALVALSRIGGKELYAAALQLSRDESAVIRRATVEALELIGTKQATEVARELLKDKDASVRAEAARFCARPYPAEAWPVVKELTEKPDPRLTSTLARALAGIGTTDALQRMEGLYEALSKDKERQYEVIQGLRYANEKAIPLLVRLVARHQDKSRAKILGQNILNSLKKEDVSSVLQSMFISDKTDLYETAAFFAATVCPSKKLEDSITALLKKDETLKSAAICACLQALITIEPARHTALFTGYLAHTDNKVREQAVRSRALCEKKDLFEAFRAQTIDKNRDVAVAALESLDLVPLGIAPGEDIAEYLKGPLQSNDRHILFTALALLGKRGKPEEFDKALAMLRPYLAGRNSDYRQRAAEVLAELGGHEEMPLIVAAQGYIGEWKILGPFLNDKENSGFKEVHEPETEIDFNAKYTVEILWDLKGGKLNEKREVKTAEIEWQHAQATKEDGKLNVAMLMPPPAYYNVAYCVADIHSPSNQVVQTLIEADNCFRLWVNGQQASERDDTEVKTHHHHSREYHVPVTTGKITLKKGSNRLLVKVANRGGPWWFRVRLLDEKGKVFAVGK